jgi:hypothetical protein
MITPWETSYTSQRMVINNMNRYFQSFVHELEKIAAAPKSSVMQSIIKTMDPRYSLQGTVMRMLEGKELIKEYRTLLRTGGPEFLPGSIRCHHA